MPTTKMVDKLSALSGHKVGQKERQMSRLKQEAAYVKQIEKPTMIIKKCACHVKEKEPLIVRKVKPPSIKIQNTVVVRNMIYLFIYKLSSY